MLVLSRKSGESIQIGPDITITVIATGKDRVKLGFDAPRHIQILRSEIEPLYTHRFPEVTGELLEDPFDDACSFDQPALPR